MVYRFGGRLLLVPLARLAAGGHVESEPVSIFAETEDPQQIGAALVESLGASERTVQAGPSGSVAQAAAGASSWTAIVTRAHACDLSEAPDGYTISPLRREGAAFLYKGEALKLPLDTTPDVLARHVLACLDADA
jgi:hypothetical protein